MSIVRAIEHNHFKMMKERNWNKTYWVFDIHGTIIKPNYEVGNIPTEFYPNAKEVLQMISKREDVVMILYTCSHPHEQKEYLEFFYKNDIDFKYVNKNPEVPTDNSGYGYYEDKPYMNVLFEDKSGFDGESDWIKVKECLINEYKSK